eukprot:2402635-Rhodomonas_salina.6
MDLGQIFESLNRVSAALGATWTLAVFKLSEGVLNPVELAASIMLSGGVIINIQVHSVMGNEIKDTVWKLWLLVVSKSLYSFAAEVSSSIWEQVILSVIILLVVEPAHSWFGDVSEVYVSSTKYIFAGALHGIFVKIHIGHFMIPLLTLVAARSFTVVLMPHNVITDGSHAPLLVRHVESYSRWQAANAL